MEVKVKIGQEQVALEVEWDVDVVVVVVEDRETQCQRSSSHDDKDDGNALPAFTPDRPAGVHFDVPLLRSTMVKAVDYFNLYLTVDMIDFIVNHTNSYAWEHITDNSHRTYALPDGSWQETNRDEIR